MCRAFVWIQVGRVRVLGREHLERVSPPLVLAANHVHYADGPILGLIVSAPARYLVARGVLRRYGGVGALVLGPWGAIAVDLRKGHGAPALAAAAQVLTRGERLVIFPEGWANMDGSHRPFKHGAIAAAKAAAEARRSPVWIVPVGIWHNRLPGAWIARLTPRVQYTLVLLASLYYRRGATVAIGEGISSADLPGDTVEATAMLEERVRKLVDEAGQRSGLGRGSGGKVEEAATSDLPEKTRGTRSAESSPL